MGDYFAAVAAAVTIAVIGFPFLLAKKSPWKAQRLVEALRGVALIMAAFLLGASCGLSWSEIAPSAKEASRQFLVWSWMAMGAAVVAMIIDWAISVLHDD